MKILIFGVSGMLGSTIFRYLSEQSEHTVVGTLRNQNDLYFFPKHLHDNIRLPVDVLDHDSVVRLFSEIFPDVVINCVGVIKQLASANDPLTVLPINSLLPHRLSHLCNLCNTRLIHVSTDCVFSGTQGNYLESDVSDAQDLYGKSKYIGEISDQKHAVTLRTSIIGHELRSRHALVDWFLSSSDQVNGFTRAIFSGLPTIELSRVIHKYVLPNTDLHGLYHVSAQPISKYQLLTLIAERYDKQIQILPTEDVVIDRSLNSACFKDATDYHSPDWPSLIDTMYYHFLHTKGQTDVR